jgi:hypothetical protein
MTTDIHALLGRYFEGRTSAGEEQALRRYFAQDPVAEDLQPYAALFRYLSDESAALAVLKEVRQAQPAATRRKPLFFSALRTVAAVAAAVLVAALLLNHFSPTVYESYAFVDGKRITDPATVYRYAESSFCRVQPETDIIAEQLRFVLENEL